MLSSSNPAEGGLVDMEGKETREAAGDRTGHAVRLGSGKPVEIDINRAADQYLPPELRANDTVQKVAAWIERTGGNSV